MIRSMSHRRVAFELDLEVGLELFMRNCRVAFQGKGGDLAKVWR